MAIGFPRVLRHERLELALGLLMLDKGWSGSAVDGGELGPGVRFAHVDRPHRFDARPRWLDPEEARGLAGLDAAPELLLGGEQKVLIERVGIDLALDPLAPACDDGENRAPRTDHPHVVLELYHVLFSCACQRRRRAASSLPMIIRASEPPMNNRLLRPPLLEWAILPPRPYGLYDAT